MSIELTDKQSLAWGHLGSDASLMSLLYGGAKGGGKSFFLCVWACQQAKMLAQQFGLEACDNPVPVGFIGRKRSVDFRNTTLATWRRVIPAHHYEIKEQKQQIIIDGRVAISFGGLDDQESINKFNSAEFAFACIDQAEETAQADISVLFGSLRLKVNGIQPKYRMLFTANPSECWLKGEFPITSESRVRVQQFAGMDCKTVYVPALFTDNKHLPSNYEATLEKAFGYDENLLAAYKNGDWSLARDSDFVVTRTMLDKLKDKTILPTEEILTAGCDPSIGGDECVMYVVKNGLKVAEKISHETNPMIIASDYVKFCREHGVVNAGIDSCGLGIGIAQRCRDLGLQVRFINSAEKANDARCQSIRDEVWLTVREMVMKQEIPPILDSTIIEQMTTFRFKTVGNKFRVLPKQGVKDKIGCSPDRADAFAYALYMQKFAKKKIEEKRMSYMDAPDDFDWRTA